MCSIRIIYNDYKYDELLRFGSLMKAEKRFQSLMHDESGLLFAIILINVDKQIKYHIFDFTENEMDIVIDSGINEQIDLCYYLKNMESLQCDDKEKREYLNLRLKLERLYYSKMKYYIETMCQVRNPLMD